MMDQGNHEVLSTRQKNAYCCSGVTISGTMQVTFLFFMKAFDTVDEQTSDLYACYL